MRTLWSSDLKYMREGNVCTDKEWNVVSNFLATGDCATKEDALICYNNIMQNYFWYKSTYGLELFKASFIEIMATLPALTVLPFSPYMLLRMVSEKKRSQKIDQQLEEMKEILCSKIDKENIYLKGEKNIKENLILNYIENLMNYILTAKYPGYEKDLIEIQQIAHEYVKVQPEKSIILDLDPDSNLRICYSKLLDVQLRAHLKIEEALEKEKLERDKIILNSKQAYLQQQVEDVYKRVAGILIDNNKASITSESSNEKVLDSPKLVRSKIEN